MAESRARDLLDLLGIGDKAATVPGMLSGGQRQRLAIARALANEPTLLLADEPTGALDSDGGQEVIELLSRLHTGGQTIVLVTHDAGRRVGGRPDRAHARRADRGRRGRRPSPSPSSPERGRTPVTVGGEVKLEVGDRARHGRDRHAGGGLRFGSFRLLQVLLLGLTLPASSSGCASRSPGGSRRSIAVAFGLTVVLGAGRGSSTPVPGTAPGARVSPYHLLAGVDALVATVALDRGPQGRHGARAQQAPATSPPSPPSW